MYLCIVVLNAICFSFKLACKFCKWSWGWLGDLHRGGRVRADLTFLTPSPGLFHNLCQISCLEMDQWFSPAWTLESPWEHKQNGSKNHGSLIATSFTDTFWGYLYTARVETINLIVPPCEKKLPAFMHYYLHPQSFHHLVFSGTIDANPWEPLHLITTPSINLLSLILSPCFHKTKGLHLSPSRLIFPPSTGLSPSSCAHLGTGCSYLFTHHTHLVLIHQCLAQSKCGKHF